MGGLKSVYRVEVMCSAGPDYGEGIMANQLSTNAINPSFYASVPDRDSAEDLLLALEEHLGARNGALTMVDGFEFREQRMDDFAALPGMFDGLVDVPNVKRSFTGQTVPGLSETELAVLAFAKVNAGEAYGVEVTTQARAKLHERDEPIFRVERVLGKEETYHTRLLLGVTQHFDQLELTEGWRPPLPLKVLIFALAKSPPALFHPILLGAEVAGVFVFNWLLERSRDLFPDHPEIRESMEQRLIEILIDEVGHIAFNRIAVGNTGVRIALPLANQVTKAQEAMNPELIGLGFDADARSNIRGFDYMNLPAEVRSRAFFV